MKYKEFLEYIYQRYSGNVKLGLERMRSILDAMGNPNLQLQGIHIAGTNGKGSTAAMCEAMSIAHGLKTGLNTSPHLIDYRERIRINGKNITYRELLRIFRTWEQVLQANEASFFEITTAIAFYYFREQQIDNAIFEVGLGGRLDGTNPFAATVAAITSISYDHTKSLGKTIAKIAGEKAGIIKPEVPLILGKMSPYAVKIISGVSSRLQAPTLVYGRDFQAVNISTSERGTTFDYLAPDLKLQTVTTNLLGQYQAINAATAITAFHSFQKRTGRDLIEDKVREALRRVNWPGRLQVLAQNPTTIIDGAHNAEGVKNLVKNLRVLFPEKRILFVLAILRDKNLSEMIADICGISNKLYITRNKSTRAAEIEEQARIARKYNTPFVTIPEVLAAVRLAQQEAEASDLLVISGSLYTISEVLAARKELFKIKTPLP
ncbi:MAG: bifunctional folylpolyglutamate synthase/dihydrofolate synthase [Candidatus Cloacimonetes bacterium]|nr:bifunctional folylpolyglutamate synthase/dihydrofolate synthase [Candidatus Cloacimonadota bacterium]